MGNPIPTDQETNGQAIEQGAGGEVPIEPGIDVSSVEMQEPKGGKI